MAFVLLDMTRYLNTPLSAMPSSPCTMDRSTITPRTISPSPSSYSCCSFSDADDDVVANEQEEDDLFQIDQDETSLRLTIAMPGVRGKDITVDIDPKTGVLTIGGYKRNNNNNSNNGNNGNSSHKKQRIQKRFTVDTRGIHVSRAIASIYQDSLVLYAPKVQHDVDVDVDDVEDEFSSPAAERLWVQEQQQQQYQQQQQQQATTTTTTFLE